MSFERLRLPRPSRRRPPLPLQWHEQPWSIYHPDPDHPIVVAGFGEAATLAADLTDLPVEREALALLDEHRRLTALLLDPPAEVGLLVGVFDRLGELPGLEAPFCQTLDIVLRADVGSGPPSGDDRRGYLALRRAHMAQGLLLLDVLVTDGDVVRSLAIGCDPDPVWFDDLPASA